MSATIQEVDSHAVATGMLPLLRRYLHTLRNPLLDGQDAGTISPANEAKLVKVDDALDKLDAFEIAINELRPQ